MQRRYSIALICIVAFCGSSVLAAIDSRPNWLSNVAPIITKIADLPDNEEPLSTGIDCTPTHLPNGSGYTDTCAYQTPIGTLANNRLLDGPNGAYPYDPWWGGFILPSVPNHSEKIVTMVSPKSWSSGWALRTGEYDPSQLKYAQYYGLPPIKVYEYRGQPSATIQDKGATVLNFATGELAYSANGEWLTGVVGGSGIVKYNFTTRETVVIAGGAQGYSAWASSYQKTNNVAITNDGRYVAITLSVPTPTGGTRPALRVYDTKSCQDQYLLYKTTTSNSCEYKDLWTGEYRTGNTQGLRDVLPTAEYPRRVRFASNDTLKFDTVYDRSSPTTFKVARYSVAMPETTTREYVGLLGMGDSYISGEGAAGTYFVGTDTKQNKCHLSWFSYPYRAGTQAFLHGHSVACSGAKTYDVTVTSVFDEKIKPENELKYGGQVSDKYSTNWKRRNQQSILNTFSPGYANQVVFAREYKPRAVLLSVGGNDIRFADILTSCANPTASSGTCYPYYEDRKQLMEQILGQYERLVKTYTSVLSESGGRLYVVGYPQIAKVDGDCGVNVKLNSSEVKFGSQLISYLNSVIKRAAAEAGAYYVDAENALNGYRLCEAPKGKAAMNGVTKGNDSGPFKLIGQESYHPTAFGHRLLSQSIVSKTTNLTTPMPAPRPNNKPTLDTSSALLQVAKAPSQDSHRESVVWQEADGIPVLLQKGKYTSNISNNNVKQGSPVQGVLHSDPIVLFEGIYDINAPLTFTVPAEIEAGFHRLDIYTTDTSGQSIDLRQIVYVAAEENDYDGDGIPNASDSCVAFPQSGKDDDNDGIDDACDGVIADAASISPEVLPELPLATPLLIDPVSTSTEEDSYLTSLIKPYAAPVPHIPAVGSNPQSKPEEKHSTSAQVPSTVSSKQMNIALNLSQRKTVAAFNNLGTENVNIIDTNSTETLSQVLGATKQPAIQTLAISAARTTTHKGSKGWVLPTLALTTLFTVLVVVFRRNNK